MKTGGQSARTLRDFRLAHGDQPVYKLAAGEDCLYHLSFTL